MNANHFTGMVGYTVNSIGAILLEISKKKEIYEQKIAELNKYFI